MCSNEQTISSSKSLSYLSSLSVIPLWYKAICIISCKIDCFTIDTILYYFHNGINYGIGRLKRLPKSRGIQRFLLPLRVIPPYFAWDVQSDWTISFVSRLCQERERCSRTRESLQSLDYQKGNETLDETCQVAKRLTRLSHHDLMGANGVLSTLSKRTLFSSYSFSYS